MKKKKSPTNVSLPVPDIRIGFSSTMHVAMARQAHCIASMDINVDGVHFDLFTMTPAEVGRRCLASSLVRSSVRGAAPNLAQLQLGLPQNTSDSIIDGFTEGFLGQAKQAKLKGTTLPPQLSPTTTLVAIQMFALATHLESKAPGPKAGDHIILTRPPGLAAAGLHALRKMGRSACTQFGHLTDAYLKPEIEIATALALNENGWSSSLTEMRDGLVAELHRLLPRQIGARIEAERIPVDHDAKRVAELYQGNTDLWSLYGPEDFGLLMFVPDRHLVAVEKLVKKKGAIAIRIGNLVRDPGVTLVRKNGETSKLAERMWHLLARRRDR